MGTRFSSHEHVEADRVPFPMFIGRDPMILHALNIVDQVADTAATVLITGETGTGKELIARQLHRASSRQGCPMIAVNCAALAETLEESELFGHVRGAFTGATNRKVGKFEAANGGTIFLDEVSTMSHRLQAKLLRILQTGEYALVGSAKNRFCDARIVAATNQDLTVLVRKGRFRQDLYYRLNVIRIELPPLRERSQDIPLLIDHFLRVHCTAYQKPGISLSAEAARMLRRYDYPGNVRELENIIIYAAIMCRGKSILPKHLPPDVCPESRQSSGEARGSFHAAKASVIEEFEQSYLVAVLKRFGGIVSRAAHFSGLSERNFRKKLKKYGISWKDIRARTTAQSQTMR